MLEGALLFVILGIIGFLVVAGGIITFIIFKVRYKTASSNEALIVTGPKLGDPEKEKNVFEDDNGRSVKIIRGGGYRLRMFQTATPIDLTSFQLQVNSEKAYTKEGIPVRVASTAVISIGSELEIMANFAEKFLGKKQGERESELKDVLNGHLRSIIASLPIEKIYNDFKEVNTQVKKIAESDLKGMGFEITSFALNDVEDVDQENGYIDALGRPHIAEVQKKANMAESDAQKETRIYQAKNDQEAQNEEIRRLTAVAESKKEKDIKEAEFQKDTNRAKANAEQAGEIERQKLAQQVKDEELKVQYIEKQRAVELEEEENKRRRSIADAEAYKTTKKAEAEAEKERIKGESEAEVIRQRGIAEAESKERMAKAMEQYGEAAIMEMMINVLPDYAEKVSAPLSQIKDMKVIDMGGSNSQGGSAKVANSVTSTMLGIQESLKETTGMDLKAMLESYVSRGNVNPFDPSPDSHYQEAAASEELNKRAPEAEQDPEKESEEEDTELDKE
ncbi:flotillin family protein [Halobacillus naozhouensis]|uniref:SPFH domain-containing protein n=1 Tax=Halobacillus naozhouensis TaxID=554880 RepID=A0ABY8IZ14_9BACI|nr:SPFH domain-containing protein [Halobacillus naozhouensis]WFT75482.1 SPFH domain-containing protein [Halobacillus naozhouensis]